MVLTVASLAIIRLARERANPCGSLSLARISFVIVVATYERWRKSTRCIWCPSDDSQKETSFESMPSLTINRCPFVIIRPPSSLATRKALNRINNIITVNSTYQRKVIVEIKIKLTRFMDEQYQIAIREIWVNELDQTAPAEKGGVDTLMTTSATQPVGHF